MNALQIKAIKKAGQIRTKLKASMFEPVNIFDACIQLDIMVKFVDVSMDGMYVSQEDAENPVILLSSLRPYPRRVFSCAHELGHHIFGHGTKIDGLSDESMEAAVYDNDEYLVDTFAGALLMPVAGIEAAFAVRNWNPRSASPVQFYTISSIFGTGYTTLIKHCKFNGVINQTQATALLKHTPAKILESLIGRTTEKPHFKIIDDKAEVSIIDIETGNYLFLPEHSILDGNHMDKIKSAEIGEAFLAIRPGIIRAVAGTKSYFIRIQKANYNGLAEYRHLENNTD